MMASVAAHSMTDALMTETLLRFQPKAMVEVSALRGALPSAFWRWRIESDAFRKALLSYAVAPDSMRTSPAILSLYNNLWKVAAVVKVRRATKQEARESLGLVQQSDISLPVDTLLARLDNDSDYSSPALGGCWMPSRQAIYIPQNLDGSLRGVHSLAHELGHALIDCLPETEMCVLAEQIGRVYDYNEISAETAGHTFLAVSGYPDFLEYASGYVASYSGFIGPRYLDAAMLKGEKAGLAMLCLFDAVAKGWEGWGG